MTEELLQAETAAPAPTPGTTRYRVTVLTPSLAGDGQRLSPIDYMVWKDQVNVLNQRQIFRLLARGPRIESYLGQLRKSEKLDFASWGGYAQNYAMRRIGFDDPASAEVYAKAPAEECFIPTFASGLKGIYLPGSVLKGAIRLALLVDRVSEGQINVAVESLNSDMPRHSAARLEASVLGASGVSRTRSISLSDSKPIGNSATKVYLLRTAVLADRGGTLEAGWKGSSRGALALNRAGDASPFFAEMATPGTVFEGGFRMPGLFRQPEVSRTFRWKSPAGAAEVVKAANHAATLLLSSHRKFAETGGLTRLTELCDALLQRVQDAQAAGRFLTCIGWGTGLLAKTLWTAASEENMRAGLKPVPGYGQALRTGMPFPKTRRLIIRSGRPVSFPGWVEVELL